MASGTDIKEVHIPIVYTSKVVVPLIVILRLNFE